MADANQLAIEVHFVPVPAGEMDERRRRLRTLLLRGAVRFVQQHTDGDQAAAETSPLAKVYR